MTHTATRIVSGAHTDDCRLLSGYEVDDQLPMHGMGALPIWATEDTCEVEQLCRAERQIAAANGWNTSTAVIGQILCRLRGDHSDS